MLGKKFVFPRAHSRPLSLHFPLNSVSVPVTAKDSACDSNYNAAGEDHRESPNDGCDARGLGLGCGWGRGGWGCDGNTRVTAIIHPPN